MSDTKKKPRTKKTKALASQLAGVQERVRGLATLPSERIEVAASASGKPANFRTHDDKQRRVMRGLHVEIGSISGPVVWVPDDAAREALRALPRGDALAFATWLAGFTGIVRLVDGHLRRDLRDGQPMQVQVTDLDHAEAAKALATFDAVSDLAGTDAEALAALLDEIGKPAEDGTEELLAQLRAALPSTSPRPDDDEEPVIPTDALVKKWGTAPGQLWVVPSLTVPGRDHRLLCGDCRDRDTLRSIGNAHQTVIYDPPWDENLMLDRTVLDQAKSILAFADGGRIGDVVRLLGAPTWVFAWDCVTSWYTPNRPLRRMKICAWYGSISSYEFNGAHYGEPAEPKQVTNTRGTYSYVPDPRGKHLSDVFVNPITSARGADSYKHEKPLDWFRMLIGNCTSGDVLDPFGGRGTTIVAAEQLGRRADAIEIDSLNVAATLERLAARGLQPRLVVE